MAHKSITPSQVDRVLGGSGGLIGSLTARLGIGAPTATFALSFLLPAVLGKMTPNGRVPTSLPSDVLGYLSGAKSMLSGSAAAGARTIKVGGFNVIK